MKLALGMLSTMMLHIRSKFSLDVLGIEGYASAGRMSV